MPCSSSRTEPSNREKDLNPRPLHRLYLGLGSNLSPRRQTIGRALSLLAERVGQVERVSSLQETVPQGFDSPHLFLNGACLVLTALSPLECLEATQEIERELGRTRKSTDGRYHDRTIDIDLLLYDQLEMQTPELTLPHPRICERPFVYVPLREIMD